MVDKLDQALSFYQQALGLRSKRQEIIANNIANADTPNYKARDFDFTQALDQAMEKSQPSEQPVSLTRTDAAHIPATAAYSSGLDLKYRNPMQPSLDGNTVDMDLERLNFMKNTSHYQADIKFTSEKLKELQMALQPDR